MKSKYALQVGAKQRLWFSF